MWNGVCSTFIVVHLLRMEVKLESVIAELVGAESIE